MIDGALEEGGKRKVIVFPNISFQSLYFQIQSPRKTTKDNEETAGDELNLPDDIIRQIIECSPHSLENLRLVRELFFKLS